MALTRWDPFSDMMSLREAMNRMFDETLTPWRRGPWREGILAVPIDVYETDDAIIVTAEVPGVKPEDVDIRVTGNTLTIRGETKAEQEQTQGNVYYRERTYGSFERSVVLPTNVDVDKIEATFENGVLKVTAPKSEQAKPRQIPVKTASGEETKKVTAK